MNDQSQLMNQPLPPPMMMSQPPPPQMMMSAPPPSSQPQMMMNNTQSQPLMMNRSYNTNMPWPQQQLGRNNINNNNNNWKGKKGNSDKRKNSSIGGQSSSGGGYNNNNNVIPNLPLSGGLNSTLGYSIPNMSLSGGQSVTGGYNVPNLPLSGGGAQSSYKPPTLNELQSQNRMKARKFYPNRKKYYNSRFAPYAPRNTTSFIIRAKKSGGIASLVSPCPVTPAVLPTPIFSPSREVLGDTAKEEWGVDGYGSMKGLIRLRSPGNDDEEEEGGGGSSESDVEEHVEVERRLDHDLSRFEMIYPNYSGVEYNNVLENRVDDQDTHIAQLEEENLTLKERLFLMERELGDLRRRMLFLERRHHVMEEVNEEVVENGSENESDGGSDVPHMGIGGGDEYASRDGGAARDVSMEEYVHDETNLKGNDEGRNEVIAEGVVSEKVEEARNELIMNEENANKTEVVSSEVQTKNESEFVQGQVSVELGEEKNETEVMRNDVENKIENELMQTNADKDEEMGTSCAENSNTEAVKNEGETKV